MSDLDAEIGILGTTTFKDLAYQVVWSDTDQYTIMDFLVAVDKKVADVSFTQELINRLNETLDADDRVTVPVGQQELSEALQGVLDSLAKFMELINRGTDSSDV